MGVSVHYWAIPSSSALLRRLLTEKAFTTLMAALFPHGCGIFYFFDEIDPEEREEILKWVIESRQEALGPEPEARRWIDEFHQELNRTRLAYPGVENRHASLAKTSQLIEARLLKELNRIRGLEAREFLSKLMFGDHDLIRDLGRRDDNLGLISLPLVREGAEVLNKLDAEALFARHSGWEEYHLASFRRWRELFNEAAAHGEIILVGVC